MPRLTEPDQSVVVGIKFVADYSDVKKTSDAQIAYLGGVSTQFSRQWDQAVGKTVSAHTEGVKKIRGAYDEYRAGMLAQIPNLAQMEMDWSGKKTKALIQHIHDLSKERSTEDLKLRQAVAENDAVEARIHKNRIERIQIESRQLRLLAQERSEVQRGGEGVLAGILGTGRNLIPGGLLSASTLGTAGAITASVALLKDFESEGMKVKETLQQLRESFSIAGDTGKALNDDFTRTNQLAEELSSRWNVYSDRVREVSAQSAVLGHTTGLTNANITKASVAIEEITKSFGDAKITAEQFSRIFNYGINDPEAQVALGRLKLRMGDLANQLEHTDNTADALRVTMQYLNPTFKELDERADSDEQLIRKADVAWKEAKRDLGLLVAEGLMPAIKAFTALVVGLRDVIHFFAGLSSEQKQQIDLWKQQQAQIESTQKAHALEVATTKQHADNVKVASDRMQMLGSNLDHGSTLFDINAKRIKDATVATVAHTAAQHDDAKAILETAQALETTLKQYSDEAIAQQVFIENRLKDPSLTDNQRAVFKKWLDETVTYGKGISSQLDAITKHHNEAAISQNARDREQGKTREQLNKDQFEKEKKQYDTALADRLNDLTIAINKTGKSEYDARVERLNAEIEYNTHIQTLTKNKIGLEAEFRDATRTIERDVSEIYKATTEEHKRQFEAQKAANKAFTEDIFTYDKIQRENALKALDANLELHAITWKAYQEKILATNVEYAEKNVNVAKVLAWLGYADQKAVAEAEEALLRAKHAVFLANSEQQAKVDRAGIDDEEKALKEREQTLKDFINIGLAPITTELERQIGAWTKWSNVAVKAVGALADKLISKESVRLVDKIDDWIFGDDKKKLENKKKGLDALPSGGGGMDTDNPNGEIVPVGSGFLAVLHRGEVVVPKTQLPASSTGDTGVFPLHVRTVKEMLGGSQPAIDSTDQKIIAPPKVRKEKASLSLEPVYQTPEEDEADEVARQAAKRAKQQAKENVDKFLGIAAGSVIILAAPELLAEALPEVLPEAGTAALTSKFGQVGIKAATNFSIGQGIGAMPEGDVKDTFENVHLLADLTSGAGAFIKHGIEHAAYEGATFAGNKYIPKFFSPNPEAKDFTGNPANQISIPADLRAQQAAFQQSRNPANAANSTDAPNPVDAVKQQNNQIIEADKETAAKRAAQIQGYESKAVSLVTASGQQRLKLLTQLGVQELIGFTSRKAVELLTHTTTETGKTAATTIGSTARATAEVAAATTSSAATVASMGLTAVAAAPAAALTSVASFGGAAVAGGAALLATLAIAYGASKLKLASGGPIVGQGGPKDDLVPFWGSNGEHVMNAAATKAIGAHNLQAANNYFASGGSLSNRPLPDVHQPLFNSNSTEQTGAHFDRLGSRLESAIREQKIVAETNPYDNRRADHQYTNAKKGARL